MGALAMEAFLASFFLSFMAIRHRYMPALAMSHHGRPSTAPLGALRWCVVRFRGRVHLEEDVSKSALIGLAGARVTSRDCESLMRTPLRIFDPRLLGHLHHR